MLSTVNNPSTDPTQNLTLEERLMSLGQEVFMLWRNRPSVIVGRFSDISAEVNTEFAEANGIPIIRRKSGGGCVYHDLGNVNYTFIVRDSKALTLEYFSLRVIEALEGLRVNAVLEFRHNDILADGLKISGAAQYHHEGMLLHHGTLLFDSDLSIIPKVLKHSGKVANIRPLLPQDMDTEEFMRRFSASNDYVQERSALHEVQRVGGKS